MGPDQLNKLFEDNKIDTSSVDHILEIYGKNNELSRKHFLKMMKSITKVIKHVNKYPETRIVRQVFAYIDRNSDGFIEKDELSEFFIQLNQSENVGQAEIDDMIKMGDKNGDGKLDWREFLDMWEKHGLGE